MTPADRSGTDDVATLADTLARTYAARALARALIVRLRADGRGELAASVVALFEAAAAEEEAERAADPGFVDPNPPDPHRE